MAIVIYHQILDLQTQCQQAYNEKMFMSVAKRKIKRTQKRLLK